MGAKTFLYARVSADDQKTDRQVIALKNYCEENNIEISDRDIFVENKSGKDMNRPQYQAMKLCSRSGDTIIISELDRLARNKELIKEELKWFKDNGIRIKILNIPTTLMDLNKETQWVLEMVNNVLIEVMSAIAEDERNKIRKRQAEGIAAAKSKGKHLGRPKAEYPSNWKAVYYAWKDETNKEMTAIKAMGILNLKRTTFYKLAKDYEKEIKLMNGDK